MNVSFNTCNANKVKEKESNTFCIIISDYYEVYGSNKTVSYYNINGPIIEIYVPCLFPFITVKRELV